MAPFTSNTKDLYDPSHHAQQQQHQSQTTERREKVLTEEQLHLLLDRGSVESRTSSEDQEQTEKELEEWFDTLSTRSDNQNYCMPNEERQNEIFMYNFFRRRQSHLRATEYLKKIESVKREKMRNLISRIRKLSVDYISLPVERVDPEEARQRESIKQTAINESTACFTHGQQILRSIMQSYSQSC